MYQLVFSPTQGLNFIYKLAVTQFLKTMKFSMEGEETCI